jgi:Flp pilus assembly protein TadG
VRPTRQRGQAVVEFGIIALLFTALMFAVVDFGLLLNAWLAVGSGSREIARNASVGRKVDFLKDEARKLNVPSLDKSYGDGPCCGTKSALSLTVEYFNQCVPGPSCGAVLPTQVAEQYYGGQCRSACPHPVPGDMVKVTVRAQGTQVITPLLRPFFGCTNGSNPKCYVPLTSTAILRFEGQAF